MRTSLLSLLRIIVLLPSYTLVLLVRLLKWLIAPPALLLQMLIGVPLVLLRLRQPLRPRFIALAEDELPDGAWVALSDDAEALAADGFIRHGDFRCDELMQGATLWLRLLGQPGQGVCAISAYLEFNTGHWPSRQFTEFSSIFTDGRVLTTNNFGLPYSLPAPTYLARLQLKDVWDARALGLLHRKMVAALPQTVDSAALNSAHQDALRLLSDSYARELQALLDQGWLQAVDENQARLTWRGALTGVWRQAWPLASLHLRAADRRARRLLNERGIDPDAFTGGALSIWVDQQPLPVEAGTITTVWAGYVYARPLAQRIDADAVLEAVVVELTQDAAGITAPCEFRYSFRSVHDQPERRIRRLRGFDLLLDPIQRTLAVTAMDREFDQASDIAAWRKMTAHSPLQALRPASGLRDLDTLLPEALRAFNAASRSGGRIEPDSASLYLDEAGVPRWQVVAWQEADSPLHIEVDARI